MAKSIQDKLDEFEKQDADSRISSKLDSFESEEDQTFQKMNELDDLERPQTKEGGNVGQFYKGLKNLTVLGKPAAFMATPVLEAARSIPKYIAENVGENTSQTPPIDMGAEYESVYPSDRASTSLLLTDIANAVGIKTSNLAKVKSKEYPQAAQFVENLTNPYNVAGIATDVGLAKGLPSAVNKTAGKLAGVEELAPGLTKNTPDLFQPKKLDKVAMAKAYLKSKAKNKQLLQTMEESGKINDAAAMMASNPKEYIRPFSAAKTLDYIEGPVVTEGNPMTSVTSSRRETGQGRLGKLLEDQNTAIEEIPRTHDVPKVDFVKAAKAQLRSREESAPTGEYDLVNGIKVPVMKSVKSDPVLLPTQIKAAEKMIDDIINVTHADSDKISLIRKVDDVNKSIIQTSKELADQVAKKVLELSSEKGKSFQKMSETPSELPNPGYREDLQWLSNLPVESDVSNVYPKNIQKNTTVLEGNYLDELGLKPMNKEVVTETEVPRDLNVTPKNQKILDIVQGKQNEPKMIPNPEYEDVMNNLTQNIQNIDAEIQSLQEGKIPAAKKYSSLYKLSKKKKALEEFYYKNLDDSAIDVGTYMDFIDKQNLMPIGYSSDLRRQGNKLMSAIGNESPQEMGSAHAAGQSLEAAGRNAQQTAMDMAPKIDSDMYHARNKEISANMSVRDLMNNQRTAPQNKLNVPVMDVARGVARQAIDLYPEYIRPYTQKAAQGAINMGTKAANTFKVPLPMQLIEFQIPRDSEEILANRDAVIAKIAQMTNDPNVVTMLQDALIKHPEKLPKVLPALVLQYPDLFEDDDYNRVDGKIFDPMLKQKALKDIQNSQALTLREKAFFAKRLEMEGVLDW